GRAALLLELNGDVDPPAILPHLTLTGGDGDPVEPELIPGPPGRDVRLRASVEGDRLAVAFGRAPAGKPALPGVRDVTKFEVKLTAALRVTEARGGRASLGTPPLAAYF